MADESAELRWHGGRHITAVVRGLPMVFDKPVEQGYTNYGATPSEAFLGVLAACTMMSVLRVAEVRKVAVEALEATADLDFDEHDRVEVIRVEFRVRTPAPAKEWEVIARLAGKFCTIEQLTGPPVEKRFVLNGKETVEAPKAE